MDKENKKMITLGKGQNGGGGGDATWGSITGTITNQTDLMNQLNLKVGSASDNTFTGNNTFTNDTLIGDLNDIALNLTVNTYGMPQIEGSDANTYKGFYINTDGIVFNDANLGDDTALGITLDSSTGDVSFYAAFGGIDIQSSSLTVNSNPVVTTDMLDTETLTFIDANNVSTTVVVYTQPQI